MTSFWLNAGLLLAVALAFILVPQLHLSHKRVGADRNRQNVSLYRVRLRELEMHHDAGSLDALQLEAGRVELARELLDDARGPEPAVEAPLSRAVPVVVALSTPVLALVLYLHWGSVDQLALARQHSGKAAQSIEKVSMRLEALLAARPDSSEGWSLLGRAYMVQDRAADAARAYERAVTLAGRPPQLLGHWAEALYTAGGRKWTAQLQALIDEALTSDPQEAASLKLAGIAAFQARQYGKAAAYWERLAVSTPDGDPTRATIANDIARARELANSAASKGARP